MDVFADTLIPQTGTVLQENLVYKDNALIKASSKLTLYESRVLLSCISKINSVTAISENDVFVISIDDLKETFDLNENSHNIFRDVTCAVENLLNRKLRLTLPNDETLVLHWVHAAIYAPKKREIRLQFARGLIPYISRLRKNFTGYRLENITKLTSVYAIDLYEIFCERMGKGQTMFEIPVRDLKKMLSVGEKYSRFSNFREKVISSAVTQINQHTNMNAKTGYRKSGRSVVAIQFSISFKKNFIEKEFQRIDDKEKKKNKKRQSQKKSVTSMLFDVNKKQALIEELKQQYPTFKRGTVFSDSFGNRYTVEKDNNLRMGTHAYHYTQILDLLADKLITVLD